MDEFEIEVSDLVSPARSRSSADGDDPSSPGPRSSPPRMAPSRRRLIGGAVALGAVGLALLVALGQLAGSSSMAIFVLPDVSRGIPRLVVAADTVPWGALTIDGHDVTGAAAYLRPGRHSVVYLAPPFPALRCAVSVPHVASDTCAELPAAPVGVSRSAFVLDLRATPDRLPPDQLQALAAATQTRLDVFASTTTVAPGEHYAAPDGATSVAREPLAASLTFTLNLDPQRPDPIITPGGCPTFCVPLSHQLLAQPGAWQVLAHVRLRWTYTPDVSGAAFIGGVSPANAQDMAVELAVGWMGPGGGWQVRIPQRATDIVCELASYQLDTVALPFTGGYSTDTAAGIPADGCVLTLDGTGGPVSRLRVLFRCGVLLAADVAAQRYAPTLVAASATERALAAWVAG